MDEQVGPRAMIDDIRENLPQLREALRELPAAIRYLADRAAEGNVHTKTQGPELKALREQIRGQQRQHFLLAAGTTATLSGTLLVTLETMPWLGWVLFVAGIVSLISGRPKP
jgi:hypothetical protein